MANQSVLLKTATFIVGIMAILIVLYRIIFLMVPMIKDGIDTKNYEKIFSALSLLV